MSRNAFFGPFHIADQTHYLCSFHWQEIAFLTRLQQNIKDTVKQIEYLGSAIQNVLMQLQAFILDMYNRCMIAISKHFKIQESKWGAVNFCNRL